MSENYKPGILAHVVASRGIDGRMIRSSSGYWVGDGVEVRDIAYDHEVTDVRPLVVLDLDYIRGERFGLPKVLDILRSFHETREIADQIEAQTRPPKPAEPTGLGAVVEDADGSLLVRVIDALKPWTCYGGPRWSWDEIDVVRVLSEGVEVDR